MSEAVLKIVLPKSCFNCELEYFNSNGTYDNHHLCMARCDNYLIVDDYTDMRHPDCPLYVNKIMLDYTEGEDLLKYLNEKIYEYRNITKVIPHNSCNLLFLKKALEKALEEQREDYQYDKECQEALDKL